MTDAELNGGTAAFKSARACRHALDFLILSLFSTAMDGEQLHQIDKLKEEAKRIASGATLGTDGSLSPQDLMMPPMDALSKTKMSS